MKVGIVVGDVAVDLVGVWDCSASSILILLPKKYSGMGESFWHCVSNVVKIEGKGVVVKGERGRFSRLYGEYRIEGPASGFICVSWSVVMRVASLSDRATKEGS